MWKHVKLSAQVHPWSTLCIKSAVYLLSQCGSTSNCLRRSTPGVHFASSLLCIFYLSVEARQTVCAGPPLEYTLHQVCCVSSISVWKHVKLSAQVHPWSTLCIKSAVYLLSQCGSTSNCLRRSTPGVHFASSLLCIFYLSVEARQTVCAGPPLEYTLHQVCCVSSISVWKHVQLSEQVRPWSTLCSCRHV